MGCGAVMSSAISWMHALLRARRLERQHRLHVLAHAVVEFERDARHGARLAPLQRDAALQPEELLEDQAELRRRAEGVEQAQVGIRRRKVGVANAPSSGPASSGARAGIRAAGLLPDRCASRMRCVRVRRMLVVSLATAFVDGHHAAHVQRGFALVIVARENFELRVEHGELAGVSCRTPPCRRAPPSSLGRARWPDSRRGTTCPPGWRARRR